MKIKLTGGTKNVEKTVITGDYAGMAKSIHTNPVKKEEVKKASGLKVKVIKPVEYKEKEEIKEEKVVEKESNKEEKEIVVKEEKKKQVVSPIEFDPSLIKKDKVDVEEVKKAAPHIHEGEPDCAVSKDNEDPDIVKFNRYLSLALETLEKSSDEDKEIMISEFKEAFKEYINEAVEEAKNKDKEETSECECESVPIYSMNSIANFMTYTIDNEYDDTEFILGKDYFSDFIKALPENITNNLLSALLSERYIIKVYCNGIDYTEDEESGIGYISLEIVPGFGYRNDEDEESNFVDEFEKDVINFGIHPTDLIPSLNKAGYNVSEFTDSTTEEVKSESSELIYSGAKYCAAKVVNIKDILADQENGKVIVIINDKGNYVTEENNIIAIDAIDDKSVDNLSIVSSAWLNDTLKSISTARDDEETDFNASNVASGAQISVNGVPSEE